MPNKKGYPMKKYVVVASNSKKETYRSKLYNTQYSAWFDMLRLFEQSSKNGKWARIVLKEISNNKIRNIAWREV